jgi:ParB family chromosome partitioning protein
LELEMTTTMDKKRALGRGLDSLIPAARQTAPVVREVVREVSAGGVLEIPVNQIEPSPYQPRMQKDPSALRELAESIKVSGVMQPITVREVTAGIVRYVRDGDKETVELKPGETFEPAWAGNQHRPEIDPEAVKYQLIAGERRWLASMLAGKETIPAIVRKVSNEQAAELSLIENLQREDLNPMEMAYAFNRLANDFGLTQEEMAARTGKDRATVGNHMRLLKLPPDAQGFLSLGKISFGHAKVLMSLPNNDAMETVLGYIIKDGLSVRQTEELAKRHMWDRTVTEVAGEPAPAKRRDPNVKEAERQLMAVLGARVTIVDKGGKGKVVIEYKTLEDFDRILEALGSRG